MATKRTLLNCSMLLIAVSLSGQALAGSCATSKAKENAVYGAAKNQCGNVTSTADMSKNPYKYVSPNKCNFGLSLPGLPGFGGGGNLSACSIVNAITGPMVQQVNKGMQDATDAAINTAGKEAVDTAVSVYQSKDLKGVADTVYGQMGSPLPAPSP
jgi:hypothetical protein